MEKDNSAEMRTVREWPGTMYKQIKERNFFIEVDNEGT